MAAKGRVQNLVAIVTGAGSGIGQASAIRLAEEGATVICADRNSGSLEITKRLIAALNLHSESYVIDISESKSCY